MICFRMDCPRDSQESSPAPQFKSIINFSGLRTIIVQLSHPYMTTGKTIALNRWTFVGKMMSLLFNMLSRLVIAFLPRSKHLLISWLHSPSAVILKPKKIKWFAIPFSSGPCFARILHHDPSFMGGLIHHSFIELDKAVVLV